MKKQTTIKTRLITNTRLIIGAAVLAGVSLSAFMIAALLNQTTCTGTPGDLSKNGSLGPDDIAIMKEIIAGTKPFDACGDMGGDGVIGPGDIADLQNLISGQSATPVPMAAPLKVESAPYMTFNKLYTADTKIPLGTSAITAKPVPIYSFTIDADVDLTYDYSLVRVTLLDQKGAEYLVYEGYPRITSVGKTTITKICDETCVLDGFIPASLNIQIEYGSIYLKTAYAALSKDDLGANVLNMGLAAYSQQLKVETDRLKINKININQSAQISEMRFKAGETSVSKLTYAEKKQLYDPTQNLPNLQGFEYYKGGTFEVLDPEMPEDIEDERAAREEEEILRNPSLAPAGTKIINAADLTEDDLETLSPTAYVNRPASFDWRIQHGENWMTDIRDQGGCGTCWVFGAVAIVEAKINIFYNQHIDADISEQDAMCKSWKYSAIPGANIIGSACNGGKPEWVLEHFVYPGITSEACFKYQGAYYDCGDKKCNKNLWNIWKVREIDNDQKSMKNAILTAGPITLAVKKWQNHTFAVAGYQNIYHPTKGYLLAVKWILKNSWGKDWGEVGSDGLQTGYAGLIIRNHQRDWTYWAKRPYSMSNPSAYQIKCVDRDGDNYCTWGLSPYKPPSCPKNCLNTWDRNDCNRDIGPVYVDQTCKMW